MLDRKTKVKTRERSELNPKIINLKTTKNENNVFFLIFFISLFVYLTGIKDNRLRKSIKSL